MEMYGDKSILLKQFYSVEHRFKVLNFVNKNNRNFINLEITIKCAEHTALFDISTNYKALK